MKKRFDSKEEAEIELEILRKEAYKRIEDDGDEIISDGSFVYTDFIWSEAENIGGLYQRRQLNEKKWFTYMGIITKQMINDLRNQTPFLDVMDIESKLVEEMTKNLKK